VRTVYVFFHIVQPREILATDRACILASVHTPVIGILAAAQELLCTDVAPVWLFS
jgi:hypothetical protein